MAARLWCPRSPDDLYGARVGEEVDPLLPFFQGDVFEHVPLRGYDPLDGERDFIMLITHPCSMRAGGQYLDEMEAVRVRRTTAIPLESWPKRAYETFPLPELLDDAREDNYAAHFYERGRVKLSDLTLGKRRAHLTRDAVIGLQQRLSHETTRVVVSTELVAERTGPVYAEIQLAQAWNEKSIPDADELSEPALTARLAEEAKEFDVALSLGRQYTDEATGIVMKWTLRQQLEQGETGKVTQAIHKLLWQRANDVKP